MTSKLLTQLFPMGGLSMKICCKISKSKIYTGDRIETRALSLQLKNPFNEPFNNTILSKTSVDMGLIEIY